MKLFFSLLVLMLFAKNIYAGCDLNFPTRWIEAADEKSNKLIINITNDRNLYLSYNLFGQRPVKLSHKIYVCSGKKLYLVTEDDTVEIFAHIESLSSEVIRLHFVDGDKLLGIIEFNRF